MSSENVRFVYLILGVWSCMHVRHVSQVRVSVILSAYLSVCLLTSRTYILISLAMTALGLASYFVCCLFVVPSSTSYGLHSSRALSPWQRHQAWCILQEEEEKNWKKKKGRMPFDADSPIVIAEKCVARRRQATHPPIYLDVVFPFFLSKTFKIS